MQLLEDNLKEIRHKISQGTITRNLIAVQNAEIRLQQIDQENQGVSTHGVLGTKSEFRKGSIVKAQPLYIKSDVVRDIERNILYNSKNEPIYKQDEPGKREKEPKMKKDKEKIKKTKEAIVIDK